MLRGSSLEAKVKTLLAESETLKHEKSEQFVTLCNQVEGIKAISLSESDMKSHLWAHEVIFGKPTLVYHEDAWAGPPGAWRETYQDFPKEGVVLINDELMVNLKTRQLSQKNSYPSLFRSAPTESKEQTKTKEVKEESSITVLQDEIKRIREENFLDPYQAGKLLLKNLKDRGLSVELIANDPWAGPPFRAAKGKFYLEVNKEYLIDLDNFSYNPINRSTPTLTKKA